VSEKIVPDLKPDRSVQVGVLHVGYQDSSSTPGAQHTVVLYGDNHWECDCTGYAMSQRADGLCRHIDAEKIAWRRKQQTG
jgi:hypothetical protein